MYYLAASKVFFYSINPVERHVMRMYTCMGLSVGFTAKRSEIMKNKKTILIALLISVPFVMSSLATSMTLLTLA